MNGDRRPAPLPPTLRGRRRYLAFKVISEEKVPFLDLINGIWHSILNFIGELESSKADISILKDIYDNQKQIGLIRCEHNYVEQIRTALALVQRIGDTRVVINVLGISGTIKAARQKFLGEATLKSFI